MINLIRQLTLMAIAGWVVILITGFALFPQCCPNDWLNIAEILVLIFALGLFLPTRCHSVQDFMATLVLVMGIESINILFSAWLTGTASLWKLSLVSILFVFMNTLLGGVAPLEARRYWGMTQGQWMSLIAFMLLLLAACSLPWLSREARTADANMMARYLILAALLFSLGYQRLSGMIRGESLAFNLQCCAARLIMLLAALSVSLLVFLPWLNNHSQFQIPVKLLAVLLFIFGLSSLLYLNERLKSFFPRLMLILALIWSLFAGFNLPNIMLPVMPLVGFTLAVFLPVRNELWAVFLWLAVLVLPTSALGWQDPSLILSAQLGSLLLLMGLWLSRRLHHMEYHLEQPMTEEWLSSSTVLNPETQLKIERWSLKHGLLGWVVALGLGAGWIYVDYQDHLTHIRERTQVQAVQMAEKLAGLINGVEIVTQSLNAFILPRITSQRDFEQFTERLMNWVGAGVSLQWAPRAIVSYIHPLEGHEAAIGHDLLTDPARRDDVKQLIQTRQPLWSGPFELRQGGSGMVYRVPVFNQGDSTENFEGVAVGLIHFPELFLSWPDNDNDFVFWVSIQNGSQVPVIVSESPPSQAVNMQLEGLARLSLDHNDLEIEVCVVPRSVLILPDLTGRIQFVILFAWLTAWGFRQWIRSIKLQGYIDQHLDELVQLKQMLDHSLVANVLFDRSGQVIWMNSRAGQVFKSSPEYILSLNCFKNPHWQRIGWTQAVQKTLEDGQSQTVDYCGPGTFGQALDVLVTFSRIDHLGQRFILEQALDLTEIHQMQRQLQESQHWYQKLFSDAPDGYFILDKKSALIIDCNKGACRLLDACLEDVVNSRPWDWVTEYQPDGGRSEDVLARSMLRLVKTGQIETDILCQRKDGSLFWLNVFLSLATRKEQDVVFMNCRDVTERKHLEQNLQATTAQLSTILENSSVGIVHIKDWRIKWSNPRMAEMFGYAFGEMIGMSLRMLHPDDASYDSIGLDAYPVLMQGEQYAQEVQLVHRNGHRFWVRLEGKLINTDHPEIGSIWIVEDISEQKQYEEQLVSFKTFVESAEDPFYVLNTDEGGQIIMVNEAAEKQFEASRDIICTWRLSDFDPDFIDADLPELFEQIKNKTLTQITTQIQTTSGKLIPVQVSVNYLVDHLGQHLVYGWFRDISKQTETERLLNDAKLKAEQANRAKSEFLSNMSHEIRTPLNGIMGLLQLLKQTSLNENQANYIQRAFTSAHVLLGIINDILDLSRIEAGYIELRSVSFKLSTVVYTVVDILTPLAAKKNLTLDVMIQEGCPDWVVGDAMRLQQILLNLGNNAIKFTDQGRVAFSIYFAINAQGRISLRFEVSDTGIGISEEQIERVFQRFIQVDSGDNRRFGGSGLGLSIVSGLVHAMHGQIGVESTLGQGSLFWFILTLDRGEPTPETAKPLPSAPSEPLLPKPESLSGLRVLVVEDNEMNRYVLLDLLDGLGAETAAAENGREGVDIILAEAPKAPFDLVLMDVQMPVMDGLEATRLLRKHDSLTDLPIIAVTAGVLGGDREKCLKAGMNDFLLKPININQLYQVISQYCLSSEAISDQPPLICEPVADDSSAVDFNLAMAIDNMGGDMEVYATLIRLFIASLDNTRQELSEVRDNSPDSMAKAAKVLHRLRGSALSTGAIGFASLIKRLETAIHSPDSTAVELEDLWHEFDNAFEQIETQLLEQVQIAGIDLQQS